MLSEECVSISGSKSTNLYDSGEILVDFPTAIRAVIEGHSIRKLEWKDSATCGKLRRGQLMLFLDAGWHEWIINDGDLLGLDWIVIQDAQSAH